MIRGQGCLQAEARFSAGNDPVGGKPYGSAFVSHLQTILNEQDKPEAESRVVNMSLGWSALIVSLRS